MTYVSALGYIHKMADIHDPTSSFLIKQILKGYQSTSSTFDVRLPITHPVLVKLIQAFEHVCSSAYEVKLLAAMCSLAFYSFLRLGEITSR